MGDSDAATAPKDELIKKLTKEKTKYASLLGELVIADPQVAAKLPKSYHDVIAELPKLK